MYLGPTGHNRSHYETGGNKQQPSASPRPAGSLSYAGLGRDIGVIYLTPGAGPVESRFIRHGRLPL
jgi:hypothetical protein